MSNRLPSVKSWPVINWEDIEEESHAPIHNSDIHNFAKFLHQGKVKFSTDSEMLLDKTDFATAWCLGATLVLP
jgi:hypothetical protein